jgi:hypothetical protein
MIIDLLMKRTLTKESSPKTFISYVEIMGIIGHFY